MSGFSLATVREFPWVSFGLFCLTYGVFGWWVGDRIPEWQLWIFGHSHLLPWEVDAAIATEMAWGFGAFLVMLLIILLTVPLRFIRLLLGSWMQSDQKAIASVFGWAMAVVLIICWLDKFAHFFVLLSAGMLCHIDLRLRGCSGWQIFFVLSAMGIGSFVTGGYLFSQFQVEAAMLWETLRFA